MCSWEMVFSMRRKLLVFMVPYEKLSIICIIVLLYVMCLFFFFKSLAAFKILSLILFFSRVTMMYLVDVFFVFLLPALCCTFHAFLGKFHLLCLHISSAPVHSLPSPSMTPISCMWDHLTFSHCYTKALFIFFIFFFLLFRLGNFYLNQLINLFSSLTFLMSDLSKKIFLSFIFGGYCY